MLEVICYHRTDTRSKVIANMNAEGIRACGDRARIVHTDHYKRRPEGDVALFYGFKAAGRELFKDYIAAGKHVVFIDLGYWARRQGGRWIGYHRITVDARHPWPYVMRHNMPPDRLDKLRRMDALEDEAVLDARRRRMEPQHVLVAGSQAKSAHSYKMEYMGWEQQAIDTITQNCDLPIWFRPKPKDADAYPLQGAHYTVGKKDEHTQGQACPECGILHINKLPPLIERAQAVVTHHSNVALHAIAMGIPVFCDDGIVKPMASGSIDDLDRIRNPDVPDLKHVQQFLQNVAYWQWSVPEMKKGAMWQWLKSQGLLS